MTPVIGGTISKYFPSFRYVKTDPIGAMIRLFATVRLSGVEGRRYCTRPLFAVGRPPCPTPFPTK